MSNSSLNQKSASATPPPPTLQKVKEWLTAKGVPAELISLPSYSKDLRVYRSSSKRLLVITPKLGSLYTARYYPNQPGVRITGEEAIAQFLEGLHSDGLLTSQVDSVTDDWSKVAGKLLRLKSFLKFF